MGTTAHNNADSIIRRADRAGQRLTQDPHRSGVSSTPEKLHPALDRDDLRPTFRKLDEHVNEEVGSSPVSPGNDSDSGAWGIDHVRRLRLCPPSPDDILTCVFRDRLGDVSAGKFEDLTSRIPT